MRKAPLAFAVAVVLGLALALPAFADHEEACPPGTDPTGTGLVYVDVNGDGNSGHITVGSCDNLPPDGHVTAAGNAAAGCGYVVADGDPTNGPEADGHVGIQGDTANGVSVVGPADGDYSPSCPHA